MTDALTRLTHLKDQWTHDYAQKLLLGRAAVAKGYGLKPEDYVSPMPGTSTVINVTPPIQPPSVVPPSRPAGLAKWILAAALAAGSAGTGGYFLGKPAAPPSTGKEQEWEVKVKVVDGKLVPDGQPVPVK